MTRARPGGGGGDAPRRGLAAPLSLAKDGRTLLAIHAQPGAKRSEILGVQGSALRVRVGAPAVEGKANRALLEHLAEVLGLRASALSLVSGESGRHKLVRIDGLDPDAVRARLLGGDR